MTYLVAARYWTELSTPQREGSLRHGLQPIAPSDWPGPALAIPRQNPGSVMASLAAGSLAFLTVLGLWCALCPLRSCIIDIFGVAQPRGTQTTSKANRAGRKDSEESCAIRWFLANHRLPDHCPKKTEFGNGVVLCTRHMTSFPISDLVVHTSPSTPLSSL